MMTIGSRIEERLKALGMSRRAAADAAGLNETFVRDVIEGRTVSPRIQSLEKLAPALQTTVEWLRTGAGDPNQIQDQETAELISIMPKLRKADRQRLADFARMLQQTPATGEK